MTYDGRQGTNAPWDDERELPQQEGWQQPRYDSVAHQRRLQNDRQQQAWQAGYTQPGQAQPGYGQQYPSQDQPWQQPGNGQQPFEPQPPPGGQPPQRQPRRRKRHTARNLIAGIGGLIVVIVVIAIAANSGNHTISTSGTSGGQSTGSSAGSAAKTAGIGSAITLTGNSSGEQMSVTVTKIISSAEPGDEFTSAPAGDRLYAVQFRIRDTGSAAYSDAPSNGAVVVDSAGQSYQAAIADTAAGCTTFPGTENIAPGASGLGCIVFEVPKAAKIGEVQFTLDSGLGPQTGQWNVTG
jgi:Domain of unknown function (DUF4352)